jgi:hypothetical protein
MKNKTNEVEALAKGLFDKIFKTWNLEELPNNNKIIGMIKMWYEGKTFQDIMTKYNYSKVSYIEDIVCDDNLTTFYTMYLCVMKLKKELTSDEGGKR